MRTDIVAVAALAPPPSPVLVLRLLELAAVLVVTALLTRRWRARPAAPTGWALALFVALALVLAAGFRPVVGDSSLLGLLYLKLLISCVLLIPYLLVLFSWSLGASSRRTFVVTTALMALVLLTTLGSPPLTPAGEPRPGWEVTYVTLIVVVWCGQSVLAAWDLWRAGRAQPAVIRSRMRSLSLGAVVIAVWLIVSANNNERETTVVVVSSLISFAGICLLALAFLMPAPLRLLWRQADLAHMADAERGLMTALNQQDIAATILPALATAFGGGGAALLDRDGIAIGRRNMDLDELSRLQPGLGGPAQAADDTMLVVAMTSGWLVVRGGRFAPVFGRDERDLLERVANLVDLALQRVDLFQDEQKSRREAQSLNNELQTFIYSVSHDLRSPIISVLGYLDCLEAEHHDELSGPGQHYLRRISANALYMQSLISDLLELSRIGRIDEKAAPVALQSVADVVAEGVRFAFPLVTVDIDDGLPVVRMSDVRARQLLTNLMENAVKHAGRPDVRVQLSSRTQPDGGVRLTVADNGQGIPETYWKKAFDVFERLDAARSGTPGTGMGLPICKRVVESIGGTMRIDGPVDGLLTGTTVHIDLPAAVLHKGVLARRGTA